MRLTAYCSLALLMWDVAAAEQFDVVQIDNATCNIVRSGTRNRDVVFPGTNEFGKCFVKISAETFNQAYSFCSLSGVLASKGSVDCHFGYYDQKHEQMSFVGNQDNVCQFVCFKK